ncbi:UNKNOWN [Stylonychia lemnae]|uniref:Uncharacterized protein n=1 Tax=Stylonychia lemnae TaxID=5949 RepID=A0A078AEY3_STYLE|nr:UNKNOWN [Stylonychia lemnae]|eukprot:CDW80829.1 UNKNOWN [Stylonychia lemnae]
MLENLTIQNSQEQSILNQNIELSSESKSTFEQILKKDLAALDHSETKDKIIQERDQLSKMVQRESDDIILNYLLQRQNAVLSKFEQFVDKSKKTFDEQQNNYLNLDCHVKGLIDTQINLLHRKERGNRVQNPHILDAGNEIRMKESFQDLNLSKQDMLDLYQIFIRSQLFQEFKEEIVKEIASVKDLHQDCILMSIASTHLANLQNQRQQYLAFRGGDKKINFLDPTNFKIYKSLTLESFNSRLNMRWFIQIENYILIQTHSKFSEILIYKDLKYQESEKILNENKEPILFLKPLYFNQNGKHYLAMASELGTVYLYQFSTSFGKLTLKDQQVPLNMVIKRNNETRMMNPIVLCIKDLPLNNSIAIGYLDDGVILLDIDFLGPKLLYRAQFLKQLSVKDVVELDATQILTLSYKPARYQTIDVVKKIVTDLGDGQHSHGLSLNLFPGFNIQKYPYVLAKESNGLFILNPIFNVYNQIFDLKTQNVEESYQNDETVIFDDSKSNTFYMVKNNFYVTKYEINPALLETLKECTE